MPVDILGTLTPGLTIPLLASGSGTGIDLGAGGSAPAGTALYGLVARILVSTASNATGGRTTHTPTPPAFWLRAYCTLAAIDVAFSKL